VALGFSETGQALQQRLANRSGGAFLIARDPTARTGFTATGTGSAAIRHDIGVASLTATGEQGEVGQTGAPTQLNRPTYTSASITADRRFGAFDGSLALTRLDEQETVLGGRFGFAPAGATSYFADVSLQHDIGRGWGTQARLRNGWTLLPGGNGFVSGGTMMSDSWSFDLWRENALTQGDRLSLRVMQPLRVRSGGYLIDVPVSYDYADRSVGYRLSEFSLAPRGREVDFEAAYRLPLFDGAGILSAHGFLRRDPGHVKAMKDDAGAAVRVSFDF
jgi:hypothetical protein